MEHFSSEVRRIWTNGDLIANDLDNFLVSVAERNKKGPNEIAIPSSCPISGIYGHARTSSICPSEELFWWGDILWGTHFFWGREPYGIEIQPVVVF